MTEAKINKRLGYDGIPESGDAKAFWYKSGKDKTEEDRAVVETYREICPGHNKSVPFERFFRTSTSAIAEFPGRPASACDRFNCHGVREAGADLPKAAFIPAFTGIGPREVSRNPIEFEPNQDTTQNTRHSALCTLIYCWPCEV
jgi:hypothetical protein